MKGKKQTMQVRVRRLLRDMAAQDPFTGAEAGTAIGQAYNLLNNYRERAIALLDTDPQPTLVRRVD